MLKREIAEVSLAALREQVMVEGPHTIAAIVHEASTLVSKLWVMLCCDRVLLGLTARLRILLVRQRH